MATAFAIIFFILLLALIVGLIKPKVVTPPGKPAWSRGQVGKYYGAALAVTFVLIGITAPKDNAIPAATAQTNPTAEAAPTPDTAPPPAPKQEIFQTTAAKLFQEYEKNEVAADEMLKGKQVILLDKIDSIDKDFTDSIVVVLKTSNQFLGAHMTMQDSEKEAAMKHAKGDSVAITCESFSRIMGAPTGRDCTFTEPIKP